MRCAILVTGMPGSGKTLFSEAAAKLGLPVVSMGDAVRSEAIRRGLDINADTLAQLSLELREKRGPAAVSELTLAQVPIEPIVVIEGVRSLAEVEYFRRHFDRVYVVAIHSSPITRYQRLSSRGRSDDPKHREDFAERDRRELSFGIGEVIALADFMLVNEEISKERFIEACISVLVNILRKCHRMDDLSSSTPDSSTRREKTEGAGYAQTT